MRIKYPMIWDIAYNNCNTHYDPILKKDIEIPPDWSVPIVPYPDGVICKASEWIEDFTFNSNWRQLGARGTPRGAYHFFRAANTSGSQANLFAGVVNKAGGIGVGDLLVMDWEEEGKMSLKTIIDFIYNVRRLTGAKDEMTPLYSRKLLLDGLNFSRLTASEKEYIKTIPLWIAGTFNDPDEVDNYDSIPNMFIPDQSKWGKVILWQYGLDVNPAGMVSGFPGGLDFDWVDPAYFEQWKTLTGEVIPPDEPPIGEPMNYRVTVKADAVGEPNIRAIGGATLGADIGNFHKGQVGLGTEVLGSSTGQYYCLKITSGADVVGWVYARWNNAPTYAIIEQVADIPPVGGLPVLHMSAGADGYETKTFDLNPL
ncbi:MAG: hypothetical protein NUV80_07515 [Candidatus Berkelbacteria bacterium]|nr:hypothetical protein [Candidatus Berkelbacteria bacterium]